MSARAERNEPGLGATYGYWRLQVDYHEALRLGPVVTEMRALYGWSGGDLPISEQFHLGGPEIVPGLAREQLWGDQALGASVQVGFDPLSLARVYTRVGAGNVWDRPGQVAFDELRFGFGIGVVVATPVGPMTADWGTVEGGGSRFYFAFGWQ
jgi:outer membrane protein assembly factor BamA